MPKPAFFWSPYALHTCATCGVPEGQFHRDGCGDAVCGTCTGQYRYCDCPPARKRRVRFIEYPLLCTRCGAAYPDFFMVQTSSWNRVVQKDHRRDVLCQPCYDYIAQLQGITPAEAGKGLWFPFAPTDPEDGEDWEPDYEPTPDDTHLDFLASLPDIARAALLDAAGDLAVHLENALEQYCETHPETSYGLIIEALRSLRFTLEQEMQEKEPEN